MAKRLRLKPAYRRLNKKVFHNLLPDGIPVRRKKMPTDTLGLCWGTYIEISRDCDPALEEATLLHEMIHVWQHHQGLPMDHGAIFEVWSRLCFHETGLRV